MESPWINKVLLPWLEDVTVSCILEELGWRSGETALLVQPPLVYGCWGSILAQCYVDWLWSWFCLTANLNILKRSCFQKQPFVPHRDLPASLSFPGAHGLLSFLNITLRTLLCTPFGKPVLTMPKCIWDIRHSQPETRSRSTESAR